MMVRTLMLACCVGVLGLTPTLEAGFMLRITQTTIHGTQNFEIEDNVLNDTNTLGGQMGGVFQADGVTISVSSRSNSVTQFPSDISVLNQTNIGIQNASGGEATFVVELTDTGFEIPATSPMIFSSDLTLNPTVASPDSSVTFEGFLDDDNGEFVTSGTGVTAAPPITLDASSETSASAQVSTTVLDTDAPFSLTSVATVTVQNNVELDYTGKNTVHAPEPGTLAFMGLGGLGMLVAARRRRRQTNDA